MSVMDQTVDVRYLGFGLDAPVEPSDREEIACCTKDGQTLEVAARELLKELMETHLTGGLPGPVNFGALVPLLRAALVGVELSPAEDSDRVHWFMLRWCTLN